MTLTKLSREEYCVSSTACMNILLSLVTNHNKIFVYDVFTLPCKPRGLKCVSRQVRHPLERLLSSWRFLFRNQAWQKMLASRPDLVAAHRSLLDATWPDFVNEILLGGAGRLDLSPAQLQVGDHPWTMLVHHFAPVWLWCSPCQDGLRPDVIVKLETIGCDGPAVMQLLNLTSSTSQPIQMVHVTTPQEPAADVGINSRYMVADYYSQLTKRQVVDLYQMYRLDHELFGYLPDPYIALAKD